MRVYIQGICGTFMAGVAVLAKQLGMQVRGSDKAMYPPMDRQLANIVVDHKYEVSLKQDNLYPEHVIIGNSMSRKNFQVEEVLNQNIPYSSGPEWVAHNVLQHRKVLAIAGTHGKTSTASMLLWILQYAGLNPGYLIGGVPKFVDKSADLGKDKWFVIEADEYDSAFFDKRAKCLHIKPFAAVINNLEHDHFDIYDSLEAIQDVFLKWVKLIPAAGGLICSAQDSCSKIVTAAKEITNVKLLNQEEIMRTKENNAQQACWLVNQEIVGEFCADWISEHMLENAMAAASMAYYHVGLDRSIILKALAKYPGVARRMELKKKDGNVFWYDDFAHHPTAIQKTIQAAKLRHPGLDIFVCLELSSYSLKQKKHFDMLKESLALSKKIFMLNSEEDLSLARQVKDLSAALSQVELFDSSAKLLAALTKYVAKDGVVLTISSKDFAGVRI
jgi:UDP-N-acetylmuramate: L-alanyl-gamma-D-glutamyl-meso-diaminopimelate ligase